MANLKLHDFEVKWDTTVSTVVLYTLYKAHINDDPDVTDNAPAMKFFSTFAEAVYKASSDEALRIKLRDAFVAMLKARERKDPVALLVSGDNVGEVIGYVPYKK